MIILSCAVHAVACWMAFPELNGQTNTWSTWSIKKLRILTLSIFKHEERITFYLFCGWWKVNSWINKPSYQRRATSFSYQKRKRMQRLWSFWGFVWRGMFCSPRLLWQIQPVRYNHVSFNNENTVLRNVSLGDFISEHHRVYLYFHKPRNQDGIAY